MIPVNCRQVLLQIHLGQLKGNGVTYTGESVESEDDSSNKLTVLLLVVTWGQRRVCECVRVCMHLMLTTPIWILQYRLARLVG